MIKKNIKELSVYLMIILFIIILYFMDLLFCPIHKLTGLYCPGCGITRMIISIFKLEFYEAFRYNPYVFIIFPFLVIYELFYIIKLITGKETFIHKIPKIIWYILLILAILFGILRNIPGFEYLLPGGIR